MARIYFPDLKRAIFQHDPEPLEFQVIFLSLVPALMNINSQPMWGLLFIIISLFKAISLYSKSLLWREASSISSAMVWAVSFYVSLFLDQLGGYPSLYMVLAFSEVWIYIRLGIGSTVSIALDHYEKYPRKSKLIDVKRQ